MSSDEERELKMRIDLGKYNDLDFLLELNGERWHIDLHNDYEAKEVKVNHLMLEICFEKRSNADYSIKSSFGKINIVFENVVMEPGDLQKIIFERGGLDNFNGSFAGGFYSYIIGFQDGEEYELQCSAAYLYE